MFSGAATKKSKAFDGADNYSRPQHTVLPMEVQSGLVTGPMLARKRFFEGQERMKKQMEVNAAAAAGVVAPTAYAPFGGSPFGGAPQPTGFGMPQHPHQQFQQQAQQQQQQQFASPFHQAPAAPVPVAAPAPGMSMGMGGGFRMNSAFNPRKRSHEDDASLTLTPDKPSPPLGSGSLLLAYALLRALPQSPRPLPDSCPWTLARRHLDGAAACACADAASATSNDSHLTLTAAAAASLAGVDPRPPPPLPLSELHPMSSCLCLRPRPHKTPAAAATASSAATKLVAHGGRFQRDVSPPPPASSSAAAAAAAEGIPRHQSESNAQLTLDTSGHHHAHATMAPPNTLRLLTYNFFLRPPLISDYNGDSKEERLAGFIEHVLPQYDVIAMQETFTGYSSRVSRLEHAAKQAGYVAHVRGPAGSMVRGHLLDAGLLVLSRWPIRARAKITYARGVTVDRLASKGATYSLHVHPDQPNVRLHLFNTHLQASYSTAPAIDDPSVVCRTDQVRELADFVHAQLTENWAGPLPHAARSAASASGPVPRAVIPENVPLPPSPIKSPDLAAVAADIPLPASPARDRAASSSSSGTDTATKPAAYDLVLVCGDLNVNSMQSGREEYTQLLRILERDGQFKVTDLLDAQGKEDYTQLPWVWFSQRRREVNADVYKREGGRLDYILLVEPRAETAHAIETRIDKCDVAHPDFFQLSDHMGVAAQVTLPKLS
ncbi:hypothetical protein H9P43_001235 [Blastocladiella emersonii ATCC 22665]|nr:hypothetical protein H9P43_001235 [Blastocladiella emersonii ATCC 22665]